MSQTLENFKQSLKGKLYASGEEGYDLSKWSENAKLPAKYIVLPIDAEDISEAIRYARSQKLELAIRGGGHSSTGASATAGGLLIDMRNMRSVNVDEEKKIVRLGGGATIVDVDVETIKYGLATTVGICSHVGVAGYVSGGGIGFSMGDHGLGADNLVSATVVLANGEIVEANDTENPELFWGVRGGGSNFGVLAEIRMKLHEQRADIYTFQVVNALNSWIPHQKTTEAIQLFFAIGPTGQPCIICNGSSNSSQEEGEKFSKPFLSLGPIGVTDSQIPYSVYSTVSDDFNAIQGQKIISGAHITQFDYETVQKAFDAWLLVTAKAPLSSIMYEFYRTDKTASVPVEATPFAHRYQDTIVLLLVLWTDQALTFQDARSKILELKRIVSSSSTQAAQDSLGYANYADAYSVRNETDEYARKLFGRNYARLQQVKKKYDPEVVWNRWFTIRPADD